MSITDNTLTERFECRWPADLLARVDEWRARQTVPPSRAAAVRWLVAHGLRNGDAATEPREP